MFPRKPNPGKFFIELNEKSKRDEAVTSTTNKAVDKDSLSIILAYSSNDNVEAGLQSTRIKPRRLYLFSQNKMLFNWIALNPNLITIVKDWERKVAKDEKNANEKGLVRMGIC